MPSNGRCICLLQGSVCEALRWSWCTCTHTYMPIVNAVVVLPIGKAGVQPSGMAVVCVYSLVAWLLVVCIA